MFFLTKQHKTRYHSTSKRFARNKTAFPDVKGLRTGSTRRQARLNRSRSVSFGARMRPRCDSESNKMKASPSGVVRHTVPQASTHTFAPSVRGALGHMRRIAISRLVLHTTKAFLYTAKAFSHDEGIHYTTKNIFRTTKGIYSDVGGRHGDKAVMTKTPAQVEEPCLF